MTTGQSTFLVDSNILVYTADVSEAAKQSRSLDVLSRLDLSGRGILSVQILGESFNAMTRRIRSRLGADQAQALLLHYSEMFLVLELSLQTVQNAMRISRDNQVSYWDAVLLSTAWLNGIPTLLTEDLSHSQIIDGLRIVNPLLPEFDLSALD